MQKILAAIICCFVLATGYIAYMIAERQAALQKFSRYNDSWAVSQGSSEYMRLQTSLAAFVLDPEGSDRDELRLRLEIMHGRLDLLQVPSLRELIRTNPRWGELIGSLTALLNTLDGNLDHLDAAGIREILPQMRALNSQFTAFASTAVTHDVELIETANNEVRRLHLIYTGLAAGLILCGVLLVILLSRHNGLLNRAHMSMRKLASELRAATLELQTKNVQLKHEAFHDALTGLPNRAMFRQDLDERLAKARVGHGSAIILLFDLDGFKDVNDTLGHDVGDKLLQAVGHRLSTLCENGDVVCRLGGDEFVFLTGGLSEDQASSLAEIIIQQMGDIYQIGDLEIRVRTCVGVAVSVDDISADELFKRADLALYEAKTLGPGHASVFRTAMQSRLLEKKSLEDDLHSALSNGEMEVHYQPQVSTSTGEILGFEALVRWTHPTRGKVPPNIFIPIAEKTGFIHALGNWVLETACLEAVTWEKPFKIAVNLSPIQFHKSDFVESVKLVLQHSGLEHSRLELEVTESVLLDETEHTFEILKQLKDLGIQIAMDDFGTGYSSLSSLRLFPFDKIKIDQSFLRDITTDPDALGIVEFVLGVGRILQLVIVAEGIETVEQFDCMRRLGCDQIQGYLVSKPIPATELETFCNTYEAGIGRSGLAARF